MHGATCSSQAHRHGLSRRDRFCSFCPLFFWFDAALERNGRNGRNHFVRQFRLANNYISLSNLGFGVSSPTVVLGAQQLQSAVVLTLTGTHTTQPNTGRRPCIDGRWLTPSGEPEPRGAISETDHRIDARPAHPSAVVDLPCTCLKPAAALLTVTLSAAPADWHACTADGSCHIPSDHCADDGDAALERGAAQPSEILLSETLHVKNIRLTPASRTQGQHQQAVGSQPGFVKKGVSLDGLHAFAQKHAQSLRLRSDPASSDVAAAPTRRNVERDRR